MRLESMKSKLSKIEKHKQSSRYLPVLFLDDEGSIDECRHLIGPDTVVIIDDIPAEDECCV
jgi:hypothetical protein